MESQEQKYYTSLYEIAAALNSTRNPEDVLHGIVENTTKVLEAKGCSLLLLTPDRKLLLHTASYGLSERYIRKGPIFADESIPEVVEGRPWQVENATTDERVQYHKEIKEEGIASTLSVPVKLRDKVVGRLVVLTGEPRHFTEADIYFVSAVANLGAISLENARLYDSARKDYEALREEVAEWRAAFPLIQERAQRE